MESILSTGRRMFIENKIRRRGSEVENKRKSKETELLTGEVISSLDLWWGRGSGGAADSRKGQRKGRLIKT